jgi:hypothetical protein
MAICPLLAENAPTWFATRSSRTETKLIIVEVCEVLIYEILIERDADEARDRSSMVEEPKIPE